MAIANEHIDDRLGGLVPSAGVSSLVRRPAAKRALDIALSGVGLVVSAPLCLLVGVSIKLQDWGPVFYGQERVGQGGRIFTALKFRTMVPDAEQRSGPVQAGAGDPRVTRIGRWLRATAMDELPQLWSILKGDMSFVGPRALRPEEREVGEDGAAVSIDQIPGYDDRQRLCPGLTGIAQIYAPRDMTRRNKFRYDRVYLKKQSFWLDLRLIALSFWVTFRGTWEHRGRKF